MKVKPCIGCGYCCKKAMCATGVAIGGFHSECPYLVHNGLIYRCRLVGLGYNIGQGMGCSSTLFNTERDQMKARLEKISTFIFTMDEFMPVLMETLKKLKGIEFNEVPPQIRVRKKTAVINEPDTIEIYGFENKLIDFDKIEQNESYCLTCDKQLTKEELHPIDNTIPYHDGDGPYCPTCFDLILKQAEEESNDD